MTNKPIHAKPSLYAFYFEYIKSIGLRYGYNILLHGSMNRDLDLVAVPWEEYIGDIDNMIDEICEAIGGVIEMCDRSAENIEGNKYKERHYGRKCYVININRDFELKYQGCKSVVKEYSNPQYYIDISIFEPTLR